MMKTDSSPTSRVRRWNTVARLPRTPICLMIVLIVLVQVAAAWAAGAGPTAWSDDVLPLFAVARLAAEPLDLDAVRAEDIERERLGLPPRYAVPHPVAVTPATAGTWEDVDRSTRMWRLRIESPGAVSLNLGFARYFMPEGGRLLIYDAETQQESRAFTAADNETHGELWTPVILADDVVVELTVPVKAADQVVLELTSINVGYRNFGEIFSEKAGSCNIDVVCPEGDDWRDDIQSVGVISTGGSTFCTGFMVNNTAEDETPYFMTANHCGINSGNAASLVVYWNFQSPTCGLQGGGSLADAQTGSFFRATYSTSDFTLVELDDAPDPAWEVSYAGWDRTSADPTSAVAIHHPNTDEKSISFEYDPCTTTSYLQTSTPGNGSHIRVTDWDEGTTEPGSSGSPLFDQNHRVVGQLHGGYAACGNDESDWYGRFSVSWAGGGSSSSRLSNWLDPGGTGATELDLLAPYASGLRVSPGGGLTSTGDVGGPFAPSTIVYMLENQSATPIGYSVTKSAAWISLTNASGTIPALGSTSVTVMINVNANSLPTGVYDDTIEFVNTTDHDGDTTRPVSLTVGVPTKAYEFTLDADPQWDTEGSWAWGQPTGGGGQYGGPDPTGGYTGNNVYGYNLSGDYQNNLPERNLTSSAIDCSNLGAVSLKFRRWLGVEVSTYDHAYVRVSNDGSNWVTLWQNGAEITESSWSLQEYDISAVADGQATVYLRWTMGTTDGSWQYCGWNIDDVEIWGLQFEDLSDVAGGDLPGKTALHPNIPNPFNPRTTIHFELAKPGNVRLSIYDLRGRAVRSLLNESRPAGRHHVDWDGKDDRGHSVGSGTYLSRLQVGGVLLERKMLLVR